MKQIEDANVLKQMIDVHDIVFILFSDMGCNVCLSIYPDIEALEKKYSKVAFMSADPSIDQSMVGAFLVLVYPTILVYVDGKETYRFERLFSLEDIDYKLSRLESLYYD
ncbi:thioredoxin family protein [Fusibacter ferrireducens]|uniref:Thioredoxin family protein n=1 Tax=Fusibacter ferrireducens TaxID=2785058 RepID=A0ABR9ZQI1_9FIRM|nr:thioredoxin family protein [Fusibacter ferrireducens]MBF4692720.1 thioredoxin family protein [Fusibacter ferrireducens]